MPTRVAPAIVSSILPPEVHRVMSAHMSDQPVKKQSKWSPEEDALIIELRGGGMKWEDISKRLPGRSAISCRLHYQNYLERRSEWDEERKNKLARLYERFKSEMWAKVAEELAIPWRAAEAMHWQLGEAEMARRAGVVPFSLAAVNMEGTRKSPLRSNTISHGSGIKVRDRARSSPRPKSLQLVPHSVTPIPYSLSRQEAMHPVGSHASQIQQQQQQAMHYRGMSLPRPAPPPPPPSSQAPPPPMVQDGPEPYPSQGPGLPPLQMQSQRRSPGLLPSVAELTTGVSPFTTPAGAPSPGPWAPKSNQVTYFATPPGGMPVEQQQQQHQRPKRKPSQEVSIRESSHRRRN